MQLESLFQFFFVFIYKATITLETSKGETYLLKYMTGL